jgi:catechol 2,3-dioxygenase-like lactoylglutathione lyase family enzyme
MAHIGLVTPVVRDYDEAIDFYVRAAGFRLVEDTALDEQKFSTGTTTGCVPPASGSPSPRVASHTVRSPSSKISTATAGT